VESPAVGDALELVLANVLEGESAAGDEVFDGARHQHLDLTDAAGDARMRLFGFERVELDPGEEPRLRAIGLNSTETLPQVISH
jgi:hypothetical protein